MSAMYLQNKYSRWYYSIINRAKSRSLHEYKEIHHILPKCLGGSDLKENLVELTCKEHFLCHLLLTKMFPGEPKIIYAAWCMSHLSNKSQHRYKITANMYESLKQKFRSAKSNEMKNNNPMSNPVNRIKHQESIIKRGKTKGTTGLKLAPKSIETKQKIREATLKSMSDERKQNIRQLQLNRSLELREKYQIAHAPQISCMHCRKIFRPGTFWRWHGDNCKQRF